MIHFHRASIPALLAFMLISSLSRAQEKPAIPDDAAVRINRLINASMETVRERATIFNEQVAAINKVDPLSLANLDSNIVSSNSGKVLVFTQFLSEFLKSGDSIARGLEDSLFILKNQSAEVANDNIVKSFEASYTSDRTAFDTYIVTLRTLYEHVLDALLFLQHTPYHINQKRLEFTKKEDLDRYQMLMKPIEETSRELRKASEESKKATELANKAISKLNKTPKTRTHKK